MEYIDVISSPAITFQISNSIQGHLPPARLPEEEEEEEEEEENRNSFPPASWKEVLGRKARY